MNWKSLFVPGANMSAAQARSFIADQPRDSFELLDVRQPSEYEEGHLPGALLLPVKDLPARMAELDPEKPLLVYCRSGVRSKAACQLLLAQGFKDVYNMSGGILAWEGEKVGGGELQGLEFFVDREFGDVFQMAYAMEEGLRQLYLALVDRAADERGRRLLERLAAYEQGHKAQLAAMFSPPAFSDSGEAGVVEGGFDRQQILDHFSARIATMKDILELGIMLEAQALDLYSRLARKGEEGKSGELFQFLAKEEATHLSYLTDELDRVLAK